MPIPSFFHDSLLDICNGLEKIGVVSHTLSRFEIGIDSPNGPINRIVCRLKAVELSGGSSGFLPYIDYFISDPDPKTKEAKINSIRVRKFPIFGRVVGLRWEGDDGGLDILDRLTQDQSLPQAIMDGRDVEITADEGGWRLSVVATRAPSKSEWDCYSAIGKHLLSARRLTI